MAGTPIPVLFFGRADTSADVFQTNLGSDDDGVVITPKALSNAVAPAGASGEAIFRNIYLTLTHDMAVDVRLTPIVDFVPLDGSGGQPDERQTLTLAGLGARTTTRFEFGLSRPSDLTPSPAFRNALRGAWFQLLVEAINGLAAGDLIIEQVELEIEIVRESLVAEIP